MSHELSFRDCIARLLMSACRPGRSVEIHVAEALSCFFMSCPISVIWIPAPQLAAMGASCHELGVPARALTEREIHELALRIPSEFIARSHDQLLVRIFEGDGALWAIDLADSEEHGSSWFRLILGGDRAVLGERLAFFKSYLQGQRELYAVIKALHGSARLAEWTSEVERLIADGQAPLFARLQRASPMIREMSRGPTPQMMALIERLSTWALQQYLGTGWRVRRMATRTSELEEFCASIRAAAAQWRARATGADEDSPARLDCLADMLGARLDRRALVTGAAFRGADRANDTLHLLRTWTLLHELARSICHRETQEHEVILDTWSRVVEGARLPLARHIERSFLRAKEDAALLRNWLRLWFCCELRWSLRDDELERRGLVAVEHWQWRADLAYVIRESLRFECFGDRPDYWVQPDALAESLRTVVVYHSIDVAGVPPAFDVNWILREIADVSRPDEYHFTAGHRQHVLEAYIAGHFLCAISVRNAEGAPGEPESTWTLAELLASPGDEPDPIRAGELLQAFSIAAVFHDVGLILFPRQVALRQTLFDRDLRLRELLRTVGDVFETAGGNIANVCVQDLLNAQHIDPASEPELAKWMDAQTRDNLGRPDHALIGAWYLHRLSQNLDGVSSNVARLALRAIVLHQAMKQRIEVKNDPAAAILVLCDELFEWDPLTRAMPVHVAMVRSLHTMAVDMEPHPSRARRIEIRGLRVHATDEGKLVAALQRGAAGARRGWPVIHIELKHPEFLETRVHHHWMTLAQNIGRVRPFRGFGPVIEVTSQIPPWIESVGGTRRLLTKALQRSTHHIASKLLSWLTHADGFQKDERWETAYLGPLDELFPEDVRLYLSSIDTHLDLALNDHRTTFPPPPSSRVLADVDPGEQR